MEQFSPRQPIKIKPTGSYFSVDAEGFIINPASLEKIQTEYLPVVHDMVEMYKKHLGSHLVNVYVRGSVAKGEAVTGVSDLDTFAYVDLSDDDIDYEWVRGAREELEQKHSFVEGFEISMIPRVEASKDYALLNQSVCVYGELIAIPRMKPGKEMMRHAPYVSRRMENFDKKLAAQETEEGVKQACTWLMKEVLRTGFELTVNRSGRYTRDLYLCYKDFSEFYPEKESEMKEVLWYALNPVGDKTKVIEIKDRIVPWLVQEALRQV